MGGAECSPPPKRTRSPFSACPPRPCFQSLKHTLPAPCSQPVPPVPASALSLALSLLLVFRTDASYARWMEALALWADVRTNCTDLINDAAVWVRDEKMRQMVVNW